MGYCPPVEEVVALCPTASQFCAGDRTRPYGVVFGRTSAVIFLALLSDTRGFSPFWTQKWPTLVVNPMVLTIPVREEGKWRALPRLGFFRANRETLPKVRPYFIVTHLWDHEST